MSLPQMIRVNTSVPFPATVKGNGVVSVLKQNGIWSINIDFTAVQPYVPIPTDYPNELIYVWNKLTKQYATITMSDLQTATQSGLPAAIEFCFDGLGASIQAGVRGYLKVPFNATINSVLLIGDKQGSVQVDIYKCATSAFNPPTTPGAAQTICGTAQPTIVNDVKYSDAVLTGWTTSLLQGDILAFAINSAAIITKATVCLNLSRV